MIHALLLFPMHSFLHVSHLYVFSSLLWLTWLADPALVTLVYPNQMQYTPRVLQDWMVLMPVYVETAEGLVKPLVILPAAIMPLTTFIIIFSRHHHPLCSCSFTPFSRPTIPLLHLTNHSHTPYPLCSHRFTMNGNPFYLWQNNVVKDSSGPLSYLV